MNIEKISYKSAIINELISGHEIDIDEIRTLLNVPKYGKKSDLFDRTIYDLVNQNKLGIFNHTVYIK